MTDIFEQLLAFQWREVEVPVTSTTMSLAHDLVEHKYWGVDGARVEDTGLAPMRISASIPFINGIVPGKGEKWSILYPNGMRAFLAACALRTTGILVHPEFGEIPCKCERLSLELSGDRRGGMMCEVSWVETLQDDDTPNPAGTSPVQDIELAALDLDASTADLRTLIPEFPEYETSFADMMRGIQGIFDTATLLSMTTAGKIKSVIYRAENIADSVDRAKSALTWGTTQKLERIKERANDLQANTLKAQGRDLVLYLVPGDTTLAGLLAQLPGAKLGDIIRLNPGLMTSAVIRKGTTVRYYKPR